MKIKTVNSENKIIEIEIDVPAIVSAHTQLCIASKNGHDHFWNENGIYDGDGIALDKCETTYEASLKKLT